MKIVIRLVQFLGAYMVREKEFLSTNLKKKRKYYLKDERSTLCHAGISILLVCTVIT